MTPGRMSLRHTATTITTTPKAIRLARKTTRPIVLPSERFRPASPILDYKDKTATKKGMSGDSGGGDDGGIEDYVHREESGMGERDAAGRKEKCITILQT